MERAEYHPIPEDPIDKRLNEQFLAKEKLANASELKKDSDVDLTDDLNQLADKKSKESEFPEDQEQIAA